VRERIANCRGGIRLTRESRKCLIQPTMEFNDQWPCTCLADSVNPCMVLGTGAFFFKPLHPWMPRLHLPFLRTRSRLGTI
jgi:hypothetical protein